MFNFMKKATEKEEKEKRKREKREKKDVKKRDRGSMSAEELLRLDEMRRSLKIRGRRKEKEKLPSGITADYSASFFAQLDRDVLDDASPGMNSNSGVGLTQSDSSEASLTSLSNQQQPGSKSLPPLPPKPPKRGILKGPRLSITSSLSNSSDATSPTSLYHNGASTANSDNNQHQHQHHHSDSNLLVRNTLQNELIAYQNLPLNKDELQLVYSEDDSSYSRRSPNQTHHHFAPGQHDSKLLHVMTSASPSADSLTDTTNSSFATPPFSLSPVGESQGFSRWRSSGSFEEQGVTELSLPDIVPLELAEPRELLIHRQPPPRSDFGFSLRRAVVLERAANGATHMRPVIFAEPGVLVQNVNDTGLLPGDRLIEVNGVNVDDKSRDEIIDLIKNSNGSVTVKVFIGGDKNHDDDGISVEKVIKHEATKYKDTVSLLQLKSPAFSGPSNSHKVIKLADKPTEDTELTSYGWMIAKIYGIESEELHRVDLTLVKKTSCKTKLPDEYCITLSQNGTICFSEMGNPLVYEGYLIGISVYTPGCSTDQKIVGFAEVAKYSGWVKKYMAISSANDVRVSLALVASYILAVLFFSELHSHGHTDRLG